MKKIYYLIYMITLGALFIILPYCVLFLGRKYDFTNGEYFGVGLPTTLFLFFGLVIAGMLSDKLED